MRASEAAIDTLGAVCTIDPRACHRRVCVCASVRMCEEQQVHSYVCMPGREKRIRWRSAYRDKAEEKQNLLLVVRLP